MMYHGYGYGGASHWGLWVLMIVAMVIFWGALAWIIVTLVRDRGTPASSIPFGFRIGLDATWLGRTRHPQRATGPG